ncbi:MAG: hypothetical protein AAF629_00550 [Chloroflexota bacterium]
MAQVASITHFTRDKWLNRQSTVQRSISGFVYERDSQVAKIDQYLQDNPNTSLKDALTHFKTVINHAYQMSINLQKAYIGDNSVGQILAMDFVERRIDYGPYPPEHIINTVMQQSVIDINMVHQSINQRMKYDENMEQLQTLYDADILAHHALAPARTAGFLPEMTLIITHLQERALARTNPYYPSLFLGLPYLTGPFELGAGLDYLVIPHEVGHLLYRNGQTQDQQGVQQVLTKKITSFGWIGRWAEELFADYYGCLIAGPISVLGFQEMLIDDSYAQFEADSPRHPIPQLRPLIQSRMLRKINAAYGPAADRLDARWRDAMQGRGKSGTNVLKETFVIRGTNQTVTGQAILEKADQVIDVITQLLQPLNADAWSGDFTTDVESINSFNQYAVDTLLKPLPATTPPETHTFLDRVQAFHQAFVSATNGSKSMKLSDWEDLIFVASWSTGGGEKDSGPD